MELRTAESKSLIRGKAAKVNSGAGSRSRQSPVPRTQLFFRSFFSPPLFGNVFLSRFLLFKMKDMHMFRSLKAHKQPGFILFSLFWVHVSQFGLVKAARRVMFLLLLLLFFK